MSTSSARRRRGAAPAAGRAASRSPPAPACTLVIFGAAGDLTKRLLLPALYDLVGARLLADEFRIIGIDRAPFDDAGWRRSATEVMRTFSKDKTAEFHIPKLDTGVWGDVSDRMRYVAGDFTQPGTFARVAEEIGDGCAIFYLAVAARFFAPIVDGLGQAGLLKQEGKTFRRIVVEKPFGSDLASAKDLNARLLAQADESQIYRIDHFLGKETVQSIMAVRFANGLIEPTWRREYIDHVEITAAETVGVEGRGGFYEAAGALRDMVPNHLFTLLCTVAMDAPNSFSPEDVRAEKAKLLGAIPAARPEEAVRAQYAAGKIGRKDCPAYRTEPDVDPRSATETYVALRLSIQNWRWAGVPFYLRTGKRLAGRQTEIAVHYKPAPVPIFEEAPAPNVIRLRIDPAHGIETNIAAKVPGPGMKLAQISTGMEYGKFFGNAPNVGYETLLYDCMIGDATLFQRADAIEASWRIVQPLLDAWGASRRIATYPAGSQGPHAADALLARDGRRWSEVRAGG